MLARAWRVPAAGAAALVILWRILAANPLEGDGTRASFISADRHEATGAYAQRERDALRAVLASNPAEVGALVLLAQEYERSGDLDRAASAYHLAARLAPQDPTVLAATAAYFLTHGPALDGLALLGRLAERHADGRRVAFPVFARLLASGEQADAWRTLLMRDPQWLGPFIVDACGRGVDALRIVPLLLARVAAGHRNPAEIGCVLDRLQAKDRWAQAYQVWLNTLSRERLVDVGFVFNGGFEIAPTGVGFDWRLAQAPERETGHAVDVLPTLGGIGARALRVDYNGKRQSGIPAAQFLALAPGRYRLSGAGRSDGMKVGRGAQWMVRCVREGSPHRVIAASERFGGTSEWRRFEVPFEIPADCGGQVLQLEPVDAQYGPVFLGGRLWFDDLVVQRLR